MGIFSQADEASRTVYADASGLAYWVTIGGSGWQITTGNRDNKPTILDAEENVNQDTAEDALEVLKAYAEKYGLTKTSPISTM